MHPGRTMLNFVIMPIRQSIKTNMKGERSMKKRSWGKKAAKGIAMALITSMCIGTTAMAATPYSFTVKKGEYGYSGSGKKENTKTTFSINGTSFSGKGTFFICPLDGSKQVGTDVGVSSSNKSGSGSYYETVYKDRTYQLMGFYDDLQSPVSSQCSCSGTWTP